MTIRRTGWLLAASLTTGVIGVADAADPASSATERVAETADATSVRLTVTMPDGELARDVVHTASVAIALEGLTPLGGRAPSVMIQLDVPPSVTLVGDVIEDPRQLARNEFLEAPFERAIDPAGTDLEFRITGEPADTERLGVSVILFLEDANGGRVFARRRVDMPLAGGATLESSVPATDSGWGRNGTLEIGQRATAHELPRADGSTLKLDELLGERPIVVMTYRAFW